MDALTFGSSVLLRHLSYSEARKMPIREVGSTLAPEMGIVMAQMPCFSFALQFSVFNCG
jgi:hypothetical protein